MSESHNHQVPTPHIATGMPNKTFSKNKKLKTRNLIKIIELHPQ